MERIDLSLKEYNNLKLLSISPNILNAEATFFYDKEEPNRLFKVYNGHLSNNQINKKIKKTTLLEDFYKSTNIPNLLIPEGHLYINNTFRGIVIPKIHGCNASCYLNSNNIPLETKIQILKQIGTILKQLRELYPNYNSSFADVHPDNFMVTGPTTPYPSNISFQTIGIDTESMKLYDEQGITNYYLFNNENISDIEKYQSNAMGLITPDYNTDLFCFIMMILEVISNDEYIYMLRLNEYKYYLDHLDKLGFDSHLLDSFLSIYENRETIDPLPYLDNITDIPKEKSIPSFRGSL